MPETWVRSVPAVRAAPKSEILMSPEKPRASDSARRMLAGLMSRWVMPRRKAKSRARVHLKMISTTRSTGSSLAGSQKSSRVPPGTYSMTM